MVIPFGLHEDGMQDADSDIDENHGDTFEVK